MWCLSVPATERAHTHLIPAACTATQHKHSKLFTYKYTHYKSHSLFILWISQVTLTHSHLRTCRNTLSHTLILFTVFSVSNYFFTPLFLASSPPYPALTLPCALSLSFNSSHFTHPLHSFIFSPSPSHPCGDSIWRSDYEGHYRGREREKKDRDK